MSKRLSFSVQELPQGGFVMMDPQGNPLKAFSTLAETVDCVERDIRSAFAASEPAQIAERFAPAHQEPKRVLGWRK